MNAIKATINEKNSLKVRQICFILLAFSPVTKIISMPAEIALVAGEGLWLTLLTSFLIEGLTILFILYLSEKRGNGTFYSLLETTFGKPAAKIIYFLIAAYLTVKSLLPVLENKAYIENTVYEMSPDRITFFVFFIFSAYLSVKGLKILGRAADIAVWFTCAGFLVALGLSVGAADYANLLPIFKKPAYNFVNALFRALPWQNDSIYILLFCGHFRPEKAYKTRITLSYFAGAFLTLVFVTTFYGIYGKIAPSQNFALPSMSVFSVIVTNIGRFDFLAIFFIMFSQVFALSIPTMLAVKCVTRALSINNSIVPSLTINGVLAFATAFLCSQTSVILSFNTNVLSYVYAGFTAFFVLTLLTTKKRSKE